MNLKKNDMYSKSTPGSNYDLTTDYDHESEYDMYSDANDQIEVGPLLIKFERHEDGCHVCVYIKETGEKIAETDISEHGIEDHMSVIGENMEQIYKAYMEKTEMEKADKIRYNSETGVNKPFAMGSGISSQGYTVRGAMATRSPEGNKGQEFRQPQGGPKYDRSLAREKAKKVLSDLKQMPKPNLPKSEEGMQKDEQALDKTEIEISYYDDETILLRYGKEIDLKSLKKVENLIKSEGYIEKKEYQFKAKDKSKKGGLTESGRKAYNRATGSNLKRPQPEGGPRKKSFCARNKGQIDMHNIDCRKTPKKRACLARKRWKCSKSEDMSKSEQLKQFMSKVESKKQLEHYSPQENLQSIDPSYKRSSVDARTKQRDTEHPHSFYYVAGTEPEHIVASGARSKYTVELPEEASIYDISEDPMEYSKQVRQKNNGAFNMDMMHQLIKEGGHHGFTASQHPDDYLRNVVGLYHSQPVKKETKLR